MNKNIKILSSFNKKTKGVGRLLRQTAPLRRDSGFYALRPEFLIGSRYIFSPRFRSCRMSEKEKPPVSLSNFTDLSFCTPPGVSIRFTFSGFPL